MNITITLTDEEKISILTDAIETNAIQYWACDYDKIIIQRDAESNITRAEFFADNQEGTKMKWTITPNTIQKGINRLFTEKFQIRRDIRDAVIRFDNDAETCDCIIQAALFGELVYG